MLMQSAILQPVPQHDIPPNQTLYLSNLNEKVRIDDLKRAIYDTFSQFGPILDIVAQRNLRMKGQAFVVFQDLNHACIAHRSMQGFVFFSKPMRVQFARGKSDALTKLEGTYVPRERGSGVDNRIKSNAASKAAAVVKNLKAMDQPNQILFLQNLPEDTDINTLKLLFGQLPGFKELRTIPKRSDIAFVEYESESYSKSAKESLQGFKITAAHALKINYAKK